jgi:hypothetical protein
MRPERPRLAIEARPSLRGSVSEKIFSKNSWLSNDRNEDEGEGEEAADQKMGGNGELD